MQKHSQRERIIAHIQSTFGAEPEYLWADSPDAAVFRHPTSRKWFAIMMDVALSRLGLSREGTVWVMNIKSNPLMIGSLLSEKGFLPAYHMNRDRRDGICQGSFMHPNTSDGICNKRLILLKKQMQPQFFLNWLHLFFYQYFCIAAFHVLVIRICHNFQPKHIDYVHIRATETNLAVTGRGRSTAVAKNVDIGKGNMHRHGTKLAALCIIVKGISNFVTTAASLFSNPVYQGDLDLWFAHNIAPLM